ncbi:PD-(D/E)XK nuclease family protein [Kineobactrum salinum]|uniref:PD-(D/E)XK nuclease family protein n=1 Tax=Kineobactrum salinum TaxID=2708301 RepID=A0A6C0U4X3_9GAMM|nr:PD-(D/E)XK nuclease family protein [Kineobactrum salinum]QIB67046.1 PD-(D/E)XK nuclease family protein [Kineobactrum salinum]
MPTAVGTIDVSLALKGDAATPERPADSLGLVHTGPRGLLQLLETRLGIPAAETPFSSRLIQYLACIDETDRGGQFYQASWEADPFAVARSLLQWRDHWYEAGWSGHFPPAAPPRLTAMAAIETLARERVAAGTGQRLQRVIALLPEHPVALRRITLADRLEDFPPLWQQLLTTLELPLEHTAAPQPAAVEGSDLHRVQQYLLAPGPAPLNLRGDGSLLALQADAPAASAPLIAALTARQLATSGNAGPAILAEQRGDLLDEALEAIGAPRLGFGASSVWRPLFQLLPLACELLWEPLNARALFQFLSHPVAPIPARQRERLTQTAAAIPGIGSEQWQQAVAACLEQEEPAQRTRHAENIRYWLEPERFPPEQGADTATLERRAQRLASWLGAAQEASSDEALRSLYTIAINQAVEFERALQRLQRHGRDRLNRDQVLRLIDDVRGSGCDVTDRGAELGPGPGRALAASHAGAFREPVEQVIWWDCQASGRVRRWPWSRAERSALAAHGVQLHSEAAQLQWQARAQLRPLLCARQQCLLVLHDDAERPHPVWDLLQSLSRNLPVLDAADPATAARLELPQQALSARSLPARSRWWQLPLGNAIAPRETESYSSLEACLHSPYQWVLRYSARIRSGSLVTLSDGSLLKGRLAHRLFELFFAAQPDIAQIAPQAIAAWVQRQLPALLQQEGALLLEAGRQAEAERFGSQLQEALQVLVEQLQQAGVTRVAMELPQQGQFAGGTLTGTIDLLATTADGREAIVDIKWGGRRYRRDSLLAGSYLQLATYAQLRLAAGAGQTPLLSYFIVSDAHMLNLDHGFFPEAERIIPDTQEGPARFWQRVEASWRWRRAQLDRGLIEVTVAGTEPGPESDPGDEGLPMPASSDRFNEYLVLTGWEPNA